MTRLLACLALAALATPAACNDHEFRSAYGKELSPPGSEGVPSSLWILGGGVALLVGAAALVPGVKGK